MNIYIVTILNKGIKANSYDWANHPRGVCVANSAYEAKELFPDAIKEFNNNPDFLDARLLGIADDKFITPKILYTFHNGDNGVRISEEENTGKDEVRPDNQILDK